MSKTISNFFSYLFHPILMPLYGTIYILNAGIFNTSALGQVQKMIYMVVVLFTILLPILFLMSIYSLKLITNIKLNERRERFFPLFFSTISVYLCYRFIGLSGNLRLIQSFFLAILILMLVSLTLSIFFKISLHMIGIGGITGLLFSMFWIYQINIIYPLMAIIIVAGILGTVRLALMVHKPAELIIGYISGFGVVAYILLTTVY